MKLKTRNKFLKMLSNTQSVFLRLFESGYQYSCLMALLPDVAPMLRRYQDLLDHNDVVSFEDEPHVTILYGLHDASPDKVKQLVSEQRQFSITLRDTSVFENTDNDVLSVAVESPELTQLNKLVKRLPHTSSYPDYRPHITLAYLKRGSGKKYKGQQFDGVELEVSTLKFSSSSGTSKTWELRDL